MPDLQEGGRHTAHLLVHTPHRGQVILGFKLQGAQVSRVPASTVRQEAAIKTIQQTSPPASIKWDSRSWAEMSCIPTSTMKQEQQY